LASNSTSLIPDNDDARLEALRRYQILDATNERVFDELVRITARLFQVPIALMSLVEEDEVLFKGNFGLPGAERVGRHLSLCSTAVLQDETVVFRDLEADPCLLTDPFVARQLNMRFYAGHALKTSDGYNIGTLCVIDRKPRQFTPPEDVLLTTLAGVAMRLLDLRLALGINPVSSFKLWDPVYKAIEGLLGRLQALAETRETQPKAKPTPLTDAMAKEARNIATVLDQHILAALQRA
jgi:hypothetical protein